MIILTFLCSDPSAGLRLHHRITECPEFLVLQCHVTAVAVSDQSCILQAQPSFFIHQAFFHRNSYDFRQKHIVSRKLPDVQHFAFKIYRRFPDGRAGNLPALCRSQVHFLEFIYFSSRSYTAVIRCKCQVLRSQIDDKLPGARYDIMGMPFFSH